MPSLYRLLKKSGVKLVKRRVTDLAELSGYDCVFNCSGIGAARLFGDETLEPVSGHVVRVSAPWLNTAMFMKRSDGQSAYAIPRWARSVSKEIQGDQLLAQGRIWRLSNCWAVPNLAEY